GSGYPSYGPVKTKKSPDIILIGDSHGKHYAEGVYKVLAEPHNLSLYIAAGTSCFHFPRFTRTTAGQDWDKNCPYSLAVGKKYIDKATRLAVVIVSHSWNSQMRSADILDGGGVRTGTMVSIENIKQGLLDLKELVGDAELVVIGSVPGAGANLYDVFTRPQPL